MHMAFSEEVTKCLASFITMRYDTLTTISSNNRNWFLLSWYWYLFCVVCTFVNQNFVRSRPEKVLSMHRLPKMTSSTTEHYKCKKIIDSWVRPQDICVREKVLSRATNNMSTHNNTKKITSEEKNPNKKNLSQVSQGLSLNVHKEKSSMHLAVPAIAKCCFGEFEEKLRLNEIQIMYLQERINRCNCAKLVIAWISDSSDTTWKVSSHCWKSLFICKWVFIACEHCPIIAENMTCLLFLAMPFLLFPPLDPILYL